MVGKTLRRLGILRSAIFLTGRCEIFVCSFLIFRSDANYFCQCSHSFVSHIINWPAHLFSVVNTIFHHIVSAFPHRCFRTKSNRRLNFTGINEHVLYNVLIIQCPVHNCNSTPKMRNRRRRYLKPRSEQPVRRGAHRHAPRCGPWESATLFVLPYMSYVSRPTLSNKAACGRLAHYITRRC
jgi:hypothetical protein